MRHCVASHYRSLCDSRRGGYETGLGDELILDVTTLLVLAILFLATFIRSAFGFGEALVSVPLLAMLMPVKVAAPVAVLVSITVAAIIIAQDWRQIHIKSALRLIIPSLIGTPLGLWALVKVPPGAIKGILAVVIICFSAYSLIRQGTMRLRNDHFAWLFGLVAGVLGGAYGMQGPPLVIFGTLRRWSPQHFRATLQGYFFPASGAVMIGYALTGLWIGAVTRYYLLALPLVVIAILLGRIANRRMTGEVFVQFVHVGLILIGSTLLYEAIR
jgi:uncharacterized membrane protein YfcA